MKTKVTADVASAVLAMHRSLRRLGIGGGQLMAKTASDYWVHIHFKVISTLFSAFALTSLLPRWWLAKATSANSTLYLRVAIRK